MKQSEPYRIAYVVKRYPRYSETFIVNEILAHEAENLDVEIFSLRGPEDTHFQNIISRVRAPVTYLPDRIQKTSEFWRELRKAAETCPGLWASLAEFADMDPREILHGAALAALVTKRGITHLHAHFASSATSAAMIASRISGVPYTFTAHAKDIFHESVDFHDLGGKIENSAGVVTVSDFNLNFLKESFPRHTARIHRIYNGLDLEKFPFAAGQNRQPVIIAVGRLIEKKGFEYLVEACAEIRDTNTPFECHIVGAGEREAELSQQITQAGLAGRVKLLGARPQDDLIRLVQSAAVMAVPCVVGDDGNRDGLPTVVLEAMALGTPCVGTRVTGMPEAILDGHTGICIEERDTQALKQSLLSLLDNENLRERFSRNARSHIENSFDIRKNSQRLREFFETCTDGAHRYSA